MRRQFLILFSIAIASTLALVILNSEIDRYEEEQLIIRHENLHSRVVTEFTESVEKFAFLMSGMRSYLSHSENFPEQEELQSFILYQLEVLGLKDSLAVSFLNREHQFVYSFNRYQIDPGNLIGTYVSAIRDSAELNRLNALMNYDNIQLFPPINLVEGWVGVPINFSVVRDGLPVGYIASLIDFKNIVEPIYTMESSADFAFRFSVNGIYFDREAVHDGSRIYHHRVDSSSYAERKFTDLSWKASEITLYDQTFKIETIPIEADKRNPYIVWLIGSFYVFLLVYGGWSLYRSVVYQRVSKKLAQANDLLQKQKATLELQNDKLEKLNSTKNRFFSIIGHDLRNPISTIINMIGLLNSGNINPKEAQQLLQQVEPAAQNTMNLLENLLEWALINNNEMSFQPEKIVVEDLINENVELLQTNADNKKIELVKVNASQTSICVDHNMVSTVIRNLISNAIKFSRSGGSIKISTEESDGYLIISVADQGVGMTQQEIENIHSFNMEPSKRGTAGERGTGLGLTLCQEFLSKHNGFLSVHSELNKGSTFKINLPVSEG